MTAKQDLRQLEIYQERLKNFSFNAVKYIFYVGSNNTTGETEQNKAVSILKSLKVKAYTLRTGHKGFWENVPENSFSIEIIDTPETPFNDNQAKQLKGQLEKGLSQYLVLTEKQPVSIL